MSQTNENQPEIKAGVDLARVRAAIGPVLSAHGVSLVDLEWLTDRGGWVLRVTIEREGTSDLGGGVSLEDCADVSRDVSSVLDVEELIPHRHHLEVSSPGLDRPLRTEADMARFAGSTAKVKLSRPAPDGQRVLRGTLDQAPAGRVAVIVDGKRVEVPFADVAEANLVFELTPQPKKAPAKKGPSKKGDRQALSKSSAKPSS
jgi:ribosome maturation factor RimP